MQVCLGLDEAGRRLFRPEEPGEIGTQEQAESYYRHKLADGREFLRKFPSLADRDVLELGSGHGALMTALVDAGARAVGVDIDSHRVTFAQSQGLAAVEARAEDLPFEPQSFDAIVCDEVIEHLADLRRALGEAFRVLRPGGYLYGVWGPAWLSYNGPHLIKVLAIPWVHLVFSDKTIVEALRVRREQRRWPASNIDARIEDFERMGRITRRKLRRAAVAAGFTIEREESHSPRWLKHAVSRVPPFDELLAGELTVVLRRPR